MHRNPCPPGMLRAAEFYFRYDYIKQGVIFMVNTKGDSGKRIADMIKKAMDDHKITTTEYEQIMMIADEDGVIDAQERRQLAELQNMIENGTIKRVAG